MATTFQEIIDRSKARVDMANSSFVSTSDWLEFVRDAYRSLYNFLGNKFQDYFVTTSANLTVGTDGTLDVPADFGKLVALDVQDGGKWKEVISASMHERNSNFRAILGMQVALFRYVKYRLLGRKLWFFPVDVSPGKTVRIWYVPLPEKVLASDSIPIEMEQWSRHMVLDCCIQACGKEETDASQYMGELLGLRGDIAGEAMNRDLQRVDVIQDVRSCSDLGEW